MQVDDEKPFPPVPSDARTEPHTGVAPVTGGGPSPPERSTPPKSARTLSLRTVVILGVVLVVLAAIVTASAVGGSDNITATPSQGAAQTSSVPLPNAEGVPESAAETHTQAPPAEGETYQNPIPVHGFGQSKGWKVQVVGYTGNATAAVLHENMFNPHPKPGYQISLVTVKFTRTGTTAQDPFWDFDWQMVSQTGDRYAEYDDVLPNDLADVGKIPPGVSATGNIAFQTPIGKEPGVVWISGAFFAVK
jgi:hypothetical protein